MLKDYFTEPFVSRSVYCLAVFAATLVGLVWGSKGDAILQAVKPENVKKLYNDKFKKTK